MKILVVDDDDDARALLETILESQGHTIESTANGRKALDLAKSRCPDLIISDIMMPEMDGFELCRMIKANKELHTVPLIFCTATFADKKDRQLAMALGASRFLIKPVKREILLETINNVLEECREKGLPVPESPGKNDQELRLMYEDRLSNKLQKKVRDLEEASSERIKAEKALRESEERFRNAFEHAGYGMAIVGLEGQFLNVNRSFCEMMGYSGNELKSMTFQEITYPDDLTMDLRKTHQVLKNEIAFAEMEKRYLHKSGDIIIARLIFSLIRDVNREPLHFIAHIENITERKQMEMALISSKARLEHLIVSSPAIIYSSKTSGDYAATFISENVRTQFGYDPREFIDDPKFWADHIHPEDAPRIFQDLQHLLERDNHLHEYRFRLKDGTYRWVRDELRLVRDAEGTPVETVGYWIDITGRKRAEEALQTSRSMLQNQKLDLEKKNIALREMLVQLESEKRRIQENVEANIDKILFPTIKKLEMGHTSPKYIDSFKKGLDQLTSSFGRQISERKFKLTPKEIEICNLIKGGSTSKEIAEYLNLSLRTIEQHRKNIRHKLKLSKKKINLSSYLQEF